MRVTPSDSFRYYRQAQKGEWGTITAVNNGTLWVWVRWDNGNENDYPIGHNASFSLLGETEFEYQVRIANGESNTE